MLENVVKGPDEKFCESCGQVVKIAAEVCPKCGVRKVVGTKVDPVPIGWTLLLLS